MKTEMNKLEEENDKKEETLLEFKQKIQLLENKIEYLLNRNDAIPFFNQKNDLPEEKSTKKGKLSGFFEGIIKKKNKYKTNFFDKNVIKPLKGGKFFLNHFYLTLM